MNRNTVILLSVVVMAIGLPLILRRIPPNGFYGFRTPRTRADPALWYGANAFAGWALLLAALATALVALFCPTHWFALRGFGTYLSVVPLIVAVAASLLWLRGRN